MCKVALLLYVGNAGFETFLQIFFGHSFAEDDENGIIACQGAEDFRDGKHVLGDANRIGMTGPGLDDSEVAGKFNG